MKSFWRSIKELSYLQYKLVLECFILVNLVFLLCWFNDFSSYSLFIYLGVFFLFSFLNLVLPKKVDKVVIGILILFLYIYFAAQEVYYSAFEQYFLFTTVFSSINEVAGVTSSVLELITLRTYFIIGLLIINLVILFFFSTKEVREKKYRFTYLGVSFGSLLLGISCFLILSLFIDQDYKKQDILYYYGTPHYFFYYVPNTNLVVNKFGVLGLLYRDTIAAPFIQRTSQYGIDDQMIIAVLERIGEENTQQENMYTNLFEGKNLVIIQAESLMNMAIDPDLTPTLYKLSQEGITFTNFNAPLLYGSTSDTEFMANTSLFPVSTGAITFVEYNQNEFATTLPNMFSEKGYYSSSYHSNYGNYYSRDLMMPTLGSDFYDNIGMGIDFLAQDSVAIEKLKWMVTWADSYFAYFVSYNGHQPYNLKECGDYPEKYYEAVYDKYPDLEESKVCYLVKNMDLDKGIDAYVEDIYNNDYDTVIIIIGDHFAKGIKEGEDGEFDEERIYNTPLIIWHEDIEPVVIDKYTSTMDLLPTIANLFGLEYDARTVFGWDIFDSDYEGFYFNNFGLIRTNHYAFDSNTNSIVMYSDKYTEEEIRIQVNEYILRMNVSRTIVETDFFQRYPDYGN